MCNGNGRIYDASQVSTGSLHVVGKAVESVGKEETQDTSERTSEEAYGPVTEPPARTK